MTKLDRKIEAVRNGDSKVFNEWNFVHGISEDDFIEGLKWLEEDPGVPNRSNEITRELGVAYGKIWRLRRWKKGIECIVCIDFDMSYYSESDLPTDYAWCMVKGGHSPKHLIIEDGTDYSGRKYKLEGYNSISKYDDIISPIGVGGYRSQSTGYKFVVEKL